MIHYCLWPNLPKMSLKHENPNFLQKIKVNIFPAVIVQNNGEFGSIERGAYSEKLDVLILVAAGALGTALVPIPPFLRAADGGERLRLLLVLALQLVDLALEVPVALEHVPEHDVAAGVGGGREPRGAVLALRAPRRLGGLEVLVSFDVLLQPDVLLHQLLVPPLALLQVVELVGSARLGLPLVVTALVCLPLEDTHRSVINIIAKHSQVLYKQGRYAAVSIELADQV